MDTSGPALARKARRLWRCSRPSHYDLSETYKDAHAHARILLTKLRALSDKTRGIFVRKNAIYSSHLQEAARDASRRQWKADVLSLTKIGDGKPLSPRNGTLRVKLVTNMSAATLTGPLVFMV